MCKLRFKKIADDGEAEIGSDVADFLRRDFYVDDGLKAFPCVGEALDMITRSKTEVCACTNSCPTQNKL